MKTPPLRHKLVTSHLRLVAKIAMGYRGYGLPIGEVISEGNVGLMQAVKKFEPERGFRLATYAMWWIKASIQEYILRSWSLVKMGTTANQKRLFFNLRKVKGKIQALDDGDLKPEHRSRRSPPAQRLRSRSGVDEPPPVRRRFAQRTDPRERRRVRRVAGLAGRRPRQPGKMLIEQDELENRRGMLAGAMSCSTIARARASSRRAA
jgi:RNA polymerase sigma-32 factor